jgi:single-stranded-DNA-specific exonuclease
MTNIAPREVPSVAMQHLCDNGYSPFLAKIFAARGITESTQLETTFSRLFPFEGLKNSTKMACLIADAIAQKKKFIVVADYDADGATACAVAVRGLRYFGADIDFIVPNRFEYGYGLTPEIVKLAAQSNPDIIITVDNGIASVDGVAEANRMGIQVLVTDHHLPGDVLPDAACIVNPSQPGCTFESKNLAGVGVMFYVLMALRSELRSRGEFADKPEPKLAELLDLVSLGTVADVVKLDQNNTILVQQGLLRMRSEKACAGIKALFEVAKKSTARAISQDLGFAIGPRLNAAGRLEDMRLGIECLLCDDDAMAKIMATRLDELNQERRSIETDMQEMALVALETIRVEEGYSLVLFDEGWHQGVIGILASRLKDKFYRPTIAFASGSNGELKGSGRSIPSLHLRDALDRVSKKHPKLIKKFGGHAAAAGLTINEVDFKDFVKAFELACTELLTKQDLSQVIETDGTLESVNISLDIAKSLDERVWGQGFPAPQFNDNFVVQEQRVIGEKHLKLKLQHITNRAKNASKADIFENMLYGALSNNEEKVIEAIMFGYNQLLPDKIHAVYSLNVNEYKDEQKVQLIVRHWQDAAVN